jgi:ketosteroid isomerase-like protein
MKLLYILILSVAAFSCSESDKNESEAVVAMINGIIAADNESDIPKVLSYYHPEAILFPPGKPEIAGLKNIEENYLSIFAKNKLQLKTTVNETTISQNWAMATGRNAGVRIALTDSTRTIIDDAFMMLLEKHEGKWKIKRLIWN